MNSMTSNLFNVLPAPRFEGVGLGANAGGVHVVNDSGAGELLR